MWSHTDALIAPYGVTKQPAASTIRNSYHLYDANGSHVASSEGAGGYAPTALPLSNATVLFFGDAIEVIGENSATVPTNRGSLDSSIVSPGGDFGAFFYRPSSPPSANTSVAFFSAHGEHRELELPGTPSSMTAGKDGILVFLRQPSKDQQQYSLFLIDPRGETHRVEFPETFDPATTSAEVGAVIYHPNQGYFLVSGKKRPEADGPLHIDLTLHPVLRDPSEETAVLHREFIRDKDPILVMRKGTADISWIAQNGAVKMFDIVEGTTTTTGQLGPDIALDTSTIGRVKGRGQNFFSTRRGDEVAIRDWAAPDRPLKTFTLTADDCGSNPVHAWLMDGCERAPLTFNR